MHQKSKNLDSWTKITILNKEETHNSMKFFVLKFLKRRIQYGGHKIVSKLINFNISANKLTKSAHDAYIAQLEKSD